LVGGFNTNVRYRGRTFHVQTEDSGPARPYIVTLVYEGGTILFSKKSEYGPSSADGSADIRERMEEQHRNVVVELKSGQMDGQLGFVPEAIREFGEGVFTPRGLDQVVLDHLG